MPQKISRHAISAVLSDPWLITGDGLEMIASIAAREHEFASGDLSALEARLGRPLGNAYQTTVRDGVAVLPLHGPMFPRANLMTQFSGATSYAMAAKDFTTAMDDPGVNGIMLWLDTPGGAVNGASELAQLIRAAKGIKPVWAFGGGTVASAGYWIGAAAERLIASDVTLVGSIGAQMGFRVPDPKEGEKSYRFVSSSSPLKNADPGTDAGAAEAQKIVDDLGQLFVDTVAEYRGVSSETVAKSYGQGAVMVSAEALKRGMIDAIGTFEGALKSLQEEISSMDLKNLSLSALREGRPDLVAVIEKDAVAAVKMPDAAAIRAEATKAERDRITAIESLAVAGADDIIAKAKADGSEPAQVAVAIVAHMKANPHKPDPASAALANIKAAEAALTPPKPVAATGEESHDPLEQSLAISRRAGMIR